MIDNCTWEFGAIRTFSGEQEGAQYGYKVTSKINGNSIFIPNSGNFKEYWVANSDIYLWSCAKNDTCTYRFDDRDELNAYSLYANRDSVSIVENTRDLGFAIRPVLPSTLDYSVKFDSNGADGNMSSLSVKHGELFVAPDAAYKCRGFVSWNTKPEANGKTYKIGDRFSISSNIELYAQWVRLSCESWTDANGYEYVDLGLSVKWATCNVGANSPEEYGDYFAWGETSTKETYDDDNCPTYGLSISQLQSQGYIDSEGNLTAQYDAATANWGGDWRMPTMAEQEELLNNCTWTWTTQNGVNGYNVKGPNGNSIFLPAAGSHNYTVLYDADSLGYYRSSSLATDSPNYAYALDFSSSYVDWNFNNRFCGRSVRPVCP